MKYMEMLCTLVGIIAFISGYCTILLAFLEEQRPKASVRKWIPFFAYFVGYIVLYECWPKHETWIDLLFGSGISIFVFLVYGAGFRKAMAGTSLAISIALLADAILVLMTSVVQFYRISKEIIPLFLLLKETMGVGVLFLALTKLFSVFFNRSLPRGELARRVYQAGANVMPLLCIVSAVTIVEQVYLLQIEEFTVSSLLSAIVTLVLLALLSFYLFGQLKETETLQIEKNKMELQHRAYAHELSVEQAAYEKMQRLRHDMKNHMILLAEFLKHEEYEEGREYIARIYSELEETKLCSNSGCMELDIILNYKLAGAEKLGIKTEVVTLVPRNLGIDTFDLNVILGNLLDNALEGVARCEEKKMKVQVKVVQGVLYLKVENTFDGLVLRDAKGGYRTRKKEKELHRIGLRSVRQVVEKYRGELQLGAKEQVFSACVVIYPDWSAYPDKRESEGNVQNCNM